MATENKKDANNVKKELLQVKKEIAKEKEKNKQVGTSFGQSLDGSKGIIGIKEADGTQDAEMQRCIVAATET